MPGKIVEVDFQSKFTSVKEFVFFLFSSFKYLDSLICTGKKVEKDGLLYKTF